MLQLRSASASLLQDWLDINHMQLDMDILQKELEAGAPDSLMNAFDCLKTFESVYRI